MKTKPAVNKNTDRDKNNKELNTEPPLSEKDEVKEAERRTNSAATKK